MFFLQTFTDRPGDHHFFIGANDANRDPATRNDAGVAGILLFVEIDSEKTQPIADTGANHRQVFADAASKHERVESAERSGISADPFFGLITKQRDGLDRK